LPLNPLNGSIDIILEMIGMGGWIPYYSLGKRLPNILPDLPRILESLEEKQIIARRDSSRIHCPKCNENIDRISLGDYLVCKNCNQIFNLQEKSTSLMFSTFKPLEVGTSLFLSECLKLSLGYKKKSTKLTTIWELGKTSSEKITVFLCIGQSSKDKILTIYGLLHYQKTPGILLYTGEIQDEGRRILETYPQELLIPVVLESNLNRVRQTIGKIDESFIRLSEQFDQVVKIFDKEVKITAKFPIVEEGWLDKLRIIELSKEGGYQFEEPALSLLWTLGIPILLKGRKDIAEGALIHSNSFWLIDAKSCMKSFDFKQETRDQVSRYIKKIEKSKIHYPDFASEGLGVITREITQETIKRVRGFFDSQKVDGTIFIGLVPALIKLFQLVQRNPEYWYRFNPNRHPQMLFHGESNMKKAWRSMKKRWNLQDSDISIIDEKLINNYYNVLMKAPMRPNPLLGDLKSVSQIILSLYETY
jgi:hypothetical protein